MSEDRIKKKLEETFPYLVNRRFSCAAVVKVDKDSSRFEFHGSPRPWSGNTIRSKVKGNSALYILEDAALNSETETSTSIPQGDNDDMNCLATDVNQEMKTRQLWKVDTLACIKTSYRMSDSSEGILSSFDNATSSGIGGEFSEEEFNGMAQWAQNNVDYEVCINPQESPLQGGATCRFSFNPELQPEVTSGLAKFGSAAPVELDRWRNGSLIGTIPASQVPGWVPVIIESQDGKRLGRTAIKYHGDKTEETLQQIVVDLNLQKRLFYKYNMYCNSGGNPETSGGEAQNSATPGLTSEENYQLESDVSKETGYLGDAETSSSESSDLQSSDSDDDISTTFRKGTETLEEPSTRRGNSKGEETYQAYVESPARWGYAISMESEKYKQMKAIYEQMKAKYEQINVNYEEIFAKYEQIYE
ncbi:hypothetical protein OS493_037767 [Desmophyllum pertusum]|uniref:Uncharacterized protein n=1 Tax=Desmophyllum pertusum TaxID=174260 RepID=A0A9X0CUD7_9CNID|nr:hypothetical protein OS493_037767 [Desmophyllum pertusum]